VKTDRCRRSPSTFTRTVAVLLAGLLFAAGQHAAGQLISFKFGGKKSALAVALAGNVGKVVKQVKKDRRALHGVTGPDGERAFPEEEVAGLIARTEKDVDQAIMKIGEPGLDALRAWAAEEFRQIQEELAASPGQSGAAFPGLATPRAAAVVASLGWLPLPGLPSVNAAAPRQDTMTAETANRLLDRAAEVVERIFVLADHDDLEVKLWVGSAPVRKATFRFWPQGSVKGSAPAPAIIQTEGKRDHVLRGLYSYRATWGEGAVTQLIQYPNPAGPSAAGTESERLDLVKGSRFFCCQFKDSYCHHVDDAKDCR
jgi:hypothetical protein